MSDSDVRGRFVWHELMTTHPDAAQGFYTKVVGWGRQTDEGLSTPYTMWTWGQQPMGGLMALPEQARKAGAPPHWLTYVGTPAIDATVEQATRLGAKTIVPTTDIPTVGRFAILADPQGAVFAAFTPATSPAQDERAGLGDFSWHELMTTDHASAFQFYSTLFGWQKTEAMDMGPMGIYQMYGHHGRTLGGMFNKPATMPAPPHWLAYIRVENVHRAAETAKSLGGQVLNGPMEVPGGDWIVQCLDPQGAAFALHHVKSQAGS